MDSTQIIRGLPFPKASWFTVEKIEETLDYVPHDGDIIIASYPKTGTNWLQYIVFQIVSKGKLFPNFNDCIFDHAPFMEMTGAAIIENMKEPRIYKHHYPYNMVKKNEKAKYIYIYRKPEDTAISYYHFAKNLGEETHELNQFIEDFISGNIGYGLYFDHVLSYFAHKDDENVLLVSYEKLLHNKKEELLRIAKYLGEEYYQTLTENDSIMDDVLERTSFDYMKKNLPVVHPGDQSGQKKLNFFRKGVAGDGKRSLNPDQLKRLRDLAMEKLKGTDLINEWFEE